MYTYITQSSRKKAIYEIDHDIYHSDRHPRGDNLRKLLQVGQQTRNALGERKRKSDGVDEQSDATNKRFRGGDMYALVANKNVRTALDVQLMAHQDSLRGDTRLAQFCTSVGVDKLCELIGSAVAIVEAPRTLALKSSTRVERLRLAASESVCICSGDWIPGATQVLRNNREDVNEFRADVMRALECGARRGTNMAVVGVPGCGKSMLFEPLDAIFQVMGKPDSKSTHPLAGILEADILLWQEYYHKDKILLFEDLLAILVGERVEIAVKYKGNVSHRNNAPMFYTSNSQLRVVREDVTLMSLLNKAMEERFKSRWWDTPLPLAMRRADFPKCARCCAAFYVRPW